jgi:general secretion pathway protein J
MIPPVLKVGNATPLQPLVGSARSRGFTLIEVLIALSITAFVATIAYTSLSSVISGVESTREAATKTYELDRALMIFSRDIRQFVARPIRDEFGQFEPALSGGLLARSMLSFTRSGWHNPRNHPRSNLQRINYLVEDDALWRESYLVLDRVGDTQPQRVKLLDGVQEMSVGFLGTYGQVEAGNDGKILDSSNWAENWIVDTSTPGLELKPPVAIEVRLLLEDWGEIRRLYEL